jgi:curved DNA-binding protein CbpA
LLYISSPFLCQGNPKAQQKFQQVSEAYEVLSDESKRSEYDRFGAQDQQQAGFRPGAGPTKVRCLEDLSKGGSHRVNFLRKSIDFVSCRVTVAGFWLGYRFFKAYGFLWITTIL